MRPAETPAVAVLAGGRATRLGPLCADVPKALLPVDGRPFVAHQLELLRRNGVDRVVMCVGHLGEQIETYVGDGRGFDMRVDYSFDGPALRGTGGAIQAALPLLGEAFFVLYGDAYLDVDYRAVFRSFYKRDLEGLMTVCRNDNRWDRSNVVFREGLVTLYDKQRPTSDMHHIDYGLSVLGADAFDPTRDRASFDLAAVFAELINRERMGGFEVAGRFYEVGSAAGLEETRAFLSARSGSRGN